MLFLQHLARFWLTRRVVQSICDIRTSSTSCCCRLQEGFAVPEDAVDGQDLQNDEEY